MSSILQAVFQNQRSFEVIPEVGSVYEGGYFAGQVMHSGTKYNLVMSPIASGQQTTMWKAHLTSSSGTSSQIDGPANTAAQVALGSHYAANFCNGRTIGGYSDWYMPSRMELNTCYYTLKKGTNGNNTGSGANPYAVAPQPVNTNFTASDPAQTSATIFQSGNSEAHGDGAYLSSTERTTNYCYGWSMNTGANYINVYKLNSKKVRAIRRVAA